MNKIKTQAINYEGRPLIYSCSGCSSAAQLANHLAIRMDREGEAEMSCIIGLGGDVKPLVLIAKKAETSGRPIIMIDGCSLQCGRHTLARHGITPDLHWDLSQKDIHKEKHVDFDPEDAAKLEPKLKNAIQELTLHLNKIQQNHQNSENFHLQTYEFMEIYELDHWLQSHKRPELINIGQYLYRCTREYFESAYSEPNRNLVFLDDLKSFLETLKSHIQEETALSMSAEKSRFPDLQHDHDRLIEDFQMLHEYFRKHLPSNKKLVSRHKSLDSAYQQFDNLLAETVCIENSVLYKRLAAYRE